MPAGHIQKFQNTRLMQLTQFRKYFGFLGQSANPFLPDSIFRLADTDRDGHITFEQFATIIDIYHNGDLDEKNEFSFGLLDEACAGEITFEELRHVAKKFQAHYASLLGQKAQLDEQ
jgi:Ca2+-binding EF-hand superfamily protein